MAEVLHQLVDVVVRGEGEATLLELVAAPERERPLRGVPWLTVIDEGKRGIDHNWTTGSGPENNEVLGALS